MPNRILKESICYSDDIDKLTPFEETVFYRLLVRVDDYGRIDARPNFLKSMLFVTKKGITEKNIEDAVARLASIGLVQVYEVTGKPFLLFPKWSLHQRIRNSKEKYPAPQNSEILKNLPQVAASCGNLPPESNPNPNPNPNPNSNPNPNPNPNPNSNPNPNLNPNPNPNPNSNPNPNLNPNPNPNPNLNPNLNPNPNSNTDDSISEYGFSVFVEGKAREWLKYKDERGESYKPVGLKSLLTEIYNNIEKYGETAVIELINTSMSSNWAGIIWDRLKSEKSFTKHGRYSYKTFTQQSLEDLERVCEEYDRQNAQKVNKQDTCQLPYAAKY